MLIVFLQALGKFVLSTILETGHKESLLAALLTLTSNGCSLSVQLAETTATSTRWASSLAKILSVHYPRNRSKITKAAWVVQVKFKFVSFPLNIRHKNALYVLDHRCFI